MFELKAKRLASVFLVLIIALFAGCSGVKTDPLAPDPTASAASPAPVPTENASETASPVPTQAAPDKIGPPSDFFSLTMRESYEKYGIFSFTEAVEDNFFDGKYRYSFMYLDPDNAASFYSPKTLAYAEYPDGTDLRPVCSDPLCTHTGTSGCPLLKCQNPFGFVCYEGRIFFSAADGSISMYEKGSNKSTEIMKGCSSAHFHKDNGGLYLVYLSENTGFEVETVCVKIAPNGEVSELGHVEGSFDGHIWRDKYLVNTHFYIREGDKGLTVELCDLLTGEIETAFEREYPDLVDDEEAAGSTAALAYMLYGDKLLVKANYHFEGAEYNEHWFINLASGEGELLSTAEHCLFSDKCILWPGERAYESDPLVIHLYYPESGKTETYDLSAMAAEIGETIPLNCYPIRLCKGAVSLWGDFYRRAEYDDGEAYMERYAANTFDFDLLSGLAFKYPEPDR